MRFGVLGPLAVWSADGEPIAVPGFKNRLLLAALLAHEGHPVPADRLVDELWTGETLPADPLAALQTKIWHLRRTLDAAEPGGRERLTRRDDGYLLRTEPDSVDMLRFGALTARAGATADLRVRESLLAEALTLWRGPAFSGFEDTAFARRLATRLEEARLAAVEARADAGIELGAHAEAIGELHELVRRHPLRERLRALHMRALYAAGRTGEALAEYQDLRTRLAAELGLDPGPELVALHQHMLARDPALSTAERPPSRPATNLPTPATELIGRDGDLDDVRARFAAGRLLTLTGPGGVGKTRLALEAANRLAPDFPDGAWLIELAALAPSSPVDEVVESVMCALHIREAANTADPLEHLVDALGDKRLLLLLDNCEHLVDAAAAISSTLLKRVPGLHLLATSQEPLDIHGESVWNVPPLRLPEPREDPAAVARSGAVALFTARAAAAAPGFALNTANLEAVAEICRRLDGIPLALELAATRVRALGAQGVIDRLDDRFRLLATGYRDAPARQRTLRAAIDWSWDLLNEAERAVLRRLAAHRDGATLEAAEAVCSGGVAPPEAVLDLLARLVDRSLVTMVDTPDGPRYRLLESVAEYSAARLRESGEDDAIRTRHRRYYLDLAQRAAAGLHGADQRRQLHLLDAEAANLRLALDTAPAADALRLAIALTWYWFLRGRSREAIRSFDTALANAEPRTSQRAQAEAWRTGFAALAGEEVDRDRCDATVAALALATGRERARAQWFLGFALFGIGDQRRSETLIDQALQGFRDLGDDWGTAAALSVRANQAHVRGDLERMARDGRRSAELFARLADDWGRLQTIEPLASLAEMSGDYEHAARLHRDGLRIAEQLGLWPDAADRLASLGTVTMLTGDHDAARDLHERAMRLATEHHHKPGAIRAAVGLALGARREGLLDEAEERMRPILEWETEMDFGPGIALALAELGFIAEQRGDAATALRLHSDGWNVAHRTGDARAMALALEGLAGAHALAGHHTRAAELLGAAHAARDSVNTPLPKPERTDVDRITDAVRECLGENAFREAYERGTRLSPTAAQRHVTRLSAGGRHADALSRSAAYATSATRAAAVPHHAYGARGDRDDRDRHERARRHRAGQQRLRPRPR